MERRAAPPARRAGNAPVEAAPVDFAFLAGQTFGDAALERDVLDIFVAQARSCLPGLLALPRREGDDVAHKLKGSCQGIGAHAAEQACAGFETAADGARPAAHARMVDAFRAAEAAIAAHLSAQLG